MSLISYFSSTMSSTRTIYKRRSKTGTGVKAIEISTKDCIVYRVPQKKLQKAIKRTIEDEIPFLDTYTLRQKIIYNSERTSRTRKTKLSKVKQCYLYSGRYYIVPKVPVKSVDFDEIVKRTIYDEIPYLFNDFTEPKWFIEQQRYDSWLK